MAHAAFFFFAEWFANRVANCGANPKAGDDA